uniref:Ribonuclease H-like domain-containing protein n=1 Tax=Tanacetum cinerariifolium TaxID=118510 RepID=A0A6L2P483_TANCI|nr:ribonuclease H-like domain-containing protein [Tanacetum cinerariifolium]
MAEGDKNVANPQQVPPTLQSLHTLSTIKLFILKKGEYDIWAMKIEHYLEHTYYPIWEVIQKVNGYVQVSTDTNGQISVLPPKTAKEILAKDRKKSKDYLAHGYTRRPFKGSHKAMVAIDGEGVDWTGHAEDEKENYALMAFNSSNLVSDTESTTSESDAKTSDLDSCESSSSEETLEIMPKRVESKPKVVIEPKVWTDASIIKEYELDSDDEHVTIPLKEQEKPSFAFVNTVKHDNPHQTLKGKGIVDIGCSRHMTGNKVYLVNYQDFNGGPVAFGGSKGYITGKDKIRTGKLDFEDVYFVKELQHFNLFFVSQMCDKKNKVLLTNTECHVLSPDFKLPDENQVLLRVPRQDNMYSFNLENIVPSRGLAYLIAKATVDESTKWHRRDTIEFCGSKGIKKEYSNARTPQQNGVAKRKNKTLIEVARTILADSFLPNTFWAEVVSTACYVLNKEPVAQEDQAFLEELERLKRQEKEANDAAETLRKTFAQSTEDLLLQAGATRANSTNYMSSMGELTFFLGLQVKQKEDGIFISQDKYVAEILKKFDFLSAKTASTPIKTKKPLVKDEKAADVDVTPKTSHLQAMKRIFRKSTTGGCQFLGRRLISWQCKKHHFIRDAYEKKLIQVLKIYTDDNVADLLTKAVDVSRLGKKIQFGLVLGALNERAEAIYEEEVWKEGVCIQTREEKGQKDKLEPTLDDSTFDDLDADHGIDYIDTEEPVNEGRLSEETEDLVSTVRPEDSTVRPDVGTADPIAPPTTTISIFDDEDITMAQTLIKMKEEKAKEKGVSIKDIEDSSRPARFILSLKPLLTIDPKDKGKCVLEEPEPAKKMTRSDLDAAQIAKDVKVARLVYEEELAELESEKEKRQMEKEASKAAIIEMYDEVQAGIKADALFAAKLQQKEREEYTIEERAKFLAKTIAAQRRFKATQRSTKIKSLYERQKRVIDDFKPMDSDDAVDKEKVLEEHDSTKVEVKQEGDEESIRKRPGRRSKMKATKKSKRQKIDSDLKEEEHLKTFLHGPECIYYRIFIYDGSSRWIKTFSEMVTRFNRMDLEELYNIVMQRFEITSLEGVDLVLWGDLRTMFEEIADDDLWKNQEEWILKSWNFYENCEVHTLTFEDGTEIYMLAKRRYPLTKETLKRILDLKLIAKCESEAVFDLLRFIQKQIDESGSHDESEKDLAPCYCNKALAIPEQTATGKETSNPFMAGSLPKTT